MKVIVCFILALMATSALAQDQYTLVFLHKRADAEQIGKEESERLMQGHMANMNRLAKEGKLLAAGPFDGGGGIFIMNTTRKEEVTEWINSDPGIQAKRWNVELLLYKPVFGGVCPAGEDYEMTNYTFVRFNPIVSKTTASSYPDIMKRHHDYLKDLRSTGNVVTEATFGNDEGGIVVMKGEVTEEAFQSDPGVLEGLILTEVKKLYIAKGSFCEK